MPLAIKSDEIDKSSLQRNPHYLFIIGVVYVSRPQDAACVLRARNVNPRAGGFQDSTHPVKGYRWYSFLAYPEKRLAYMKASGHNVAFRPNRKLALSRTGKRTQSCQRKPYRRQMCGATSGSIASNPISPRVEWELFIKRPMRKRTKTWPSKFSCPAWRKTQPRWSDFDRKRSDLPSFATKILSGFMNSDKLTASTSWPWNTSTASTFMSTSAAMDSSTWRKLRWF